MLVLKCLSLSRIHCSYLVVRSRLVGRLPVVLDRSLVLAHRILIVHRIQLASRSFGAGRVGRAAAAGAESVVRRSLRGLDPDRIVVQDREMSNRGWERRRRIGRLERWGCRTLAARCQCRCRLTKHRSSRSRRCWACCAR